MKIFRIVLLAALFYSPQVGAEMAIMAPPEPPALNPHPPQSVAEQKRVDFAVGQIRAKYGNKIEIRHPHVIPWSFQAFEKNQQAAKVAPPTPSEPVIPEVEAQAKRAPSIVAAESSMPRPQLKPDEFMVHAYVKYEGDPLWHHLDVILTEDSAGHLALRGFFDVVMPQDHGSLPPGVVC